MGVIGQKRWAMISLPERCPTGVAELTKAHAAAG
jgi:hypothetical protein